MKVLKSFQLIQTKPFEDSQGCRHMLPRSRQWGEAAIGLSKHGLQVGGRGGDGLFFEVRDFMVILKSEGMSFEFNKRNIHSVSPV